MTVMAVTERDPDLLREASEWFARLDGAEVTAEDLERFAAWRRRSPDHEQAFHDLSAMWSSPELDEALSALTSADSTSSSLSISSPYRTRVWATAAAAVLILITLWSMNAGVLTSLQADYRTATGEQRTVHLEDRSSIILNTNTALSASLEGPIRRVRLFKGEALFRVHHDPGRPFIVEYEGHVIRVLGTEFLAREHDHVLTVTVIRGTVEVGTSGPVSASIQQLTAGQQVSAGVDGLGIPRTVDPDDFTAWTARRLRVTNVPLSDVIEELQRYHTGFIWIWNPAARSIRVTGIYDLSDPGRTLTVLAGTLPIRMDRLTDRFVVLR